MSNHQLKLYFETTANNVKQNIKTELYQTIFSPVQSNKSIVAVRGRNSGAYINAGSFIWSNSVKALVFFLIQAKIAWEIKSDLNQPIWSGNKNSNCYKLIVTLNREPLWINDMFGSDSRGRSRLHHLLLISNRYLNFGTQVAINLNIKCFTPADIQIYLNNHLIYDFNILLRIQKNILPNEDSIQQVTDNFHKNISFA